MKTLQKEVPVSAATPQDFPDLGALFDAHVAKEFADHDVNAAMETWSPSPMFTGFLL